MGGFEAVYEKIKAYSEMTKSECAFIYEIDDQVKKVRTQFPVKKDRRDALYRQFYEV